MNLSSPPHPFEALERESTLATRVVTRLEAMIAEGQLRPGDRLPPERELARQFGVSRTVVREAVTHLSAKSLLQAAPGGGALVRAPDASHVSQGMTQLLRAGEQEIVGEQVQEVRRMLETEIAGLAAARRSADDVEILRQSLEEMAQLNAQRGRSRSKKPNEALVEKQVRNDVEFHGALARATQNPLFVVLLDSVADIMLEVRRLGLRIEDSRVGALEHHRAIFTAVEASDELAARAAMGLHLDESEAIMQRAWSEAKS